MLHQFILKIRALVVVQFNSGFPCDTLFGLLGYGMLSCIFAALCVGVAAGKAEAHHIQGLPHYNYSKNYPQIPSYEEIRITDDWQITFSYLRIFETKNINLAIYLKNLKTGKPFGGSVRFLVFDKGEEPEETDFIDKAPDQTHTHRVGWTYEKEGIYTLRILFNDGTKTYEEDLKMQMGRVGFNFLWLIIPGCAILILMCLIVIKRFREDTNPIELGN